ncbi:hypothetical protein Pint_01796 [Pistacia integerrima]|uniref:Uncharacterized protein n=1 Tax=Pistacia integerrima TaxID=434235 RepID=A0ACC0ZEZ5_9ROSI|nr:hypothetical protein Pint_01796 [Pistacia integerrima]
MVIEVSVHNTKSRTKALTIAGGFAVALQGEDLRRIEVTGDGIDAVTLTTLLRKNLGHAELVSVSPVTVAVVTGAILVKKIKDQKMKNIPRSQRRHSSSGVLVMVITGFCITVTMTLMITMAETEIITVAPLCKQYI